MKILLSLVLWDFRRELRRREAILNMVLFSILLLFLISIGIGPLFSKVRGFSEDAFIQSLVHRVGAVLFWITTLFAGTVGLSQSFASEREGGNMTGLILSPIDLGIFYVAKVIAVWVYVLIMIVCLLVSYLILFNFAEWDRLPKMFACLMAFSLGYIGIGVILAAMTSALRGGGEVVLRILLIPLLIPMIYLTLRVEEATFGYDVTGGVFGDPVSFGNYLAIISALDVIYLTSGFLIFPKIFEE